MHRATLLCLLGIGLCGAVVGCESEPRFPSFPLDGITVFVGFDEPICGATFDWIEARLRWLERETGLPASASPISYYWLRDDIYDYCPTGACASARGNSIYTPLELFTHELVHGHFAQLGVPRPWLAEGMAQMFEDGWWLPVDPPMTPSAMLASKARGLSYDSAASFVRYLRDRFGMPAMLELYAALDRVDAQATPDIFLAVLGEDWDTVERDYLAAYTPVHVGALNCDFPELAPEAETWTLPLAMPCEDTTTIGPHLGWMDSDPPYTKRFVTLEIREAGTYAVTMTSSASVSIRLYDCDAPPEYFSAYQAQLNEEIYLVPGRKRLSISVDIADEAVGEFVLRGPLTTPGP